MAAKPLPDAAYLRECFDYDPETGVLTWKHRPREHFNSHHAWKCWNARFPGSEAGSRKHAGGYPIMCLDDVRYKAHRLVWVFQTGTEPPPQIDHRNRDRADNRWTNLRAATQSENSFNMKDRVGRSLPRNVYLDKRWGRKFLAKVGTIRIGWFATSEAAAEAARQFRDAMDS